MMQVVWGRYPLADAEYLFQCRSRDIDLTPYAGEIRAALDDLGTLRLTSQEASYLRSIRFIKPGFVDFLQGFRLDPSQIHLTSDSGFALRIKGPWLATILFEVPILALINEVVCRHTQPFTPETQAEGMHRLEDKLAQIQAAPVPLRIMEFGTRRRYSQAWQRAVVERLAPHLIGTSNVHLAQQLNLKPFGTMAHEFLQAGQALAPLRLSQKYMLHDSGDPFVWGEKLVAFYESLGIDPHTKTAIFSDGLNIPKAIQLAERFEGRIRTIFGIGTDLTNDLGGKALQIVIKLVRLNGQPVVKLSDSPGKAITDDPSYLDYVQRTFYR